MPRGGKRKGSGRPSGSGRYNEATQPIRVPQSMKEHLLSALQEGAFTVPLYSSTVAAGFPSAAEDHIEARIDANSLVLDNPATTFFLRVSGESMRDAGIFDGDYIAVDRSLDARSGDIVVASVDGEFTVKRLLMSRGRVRLHPENPDFPDFVASKEEQVNIFGVVSAVIRRLQYQAKR